MYSDGAGLVSNLYTPSYTCKPGVPSSQPGGIPQGGNSGFQGAARSETGRLYTAGILIFQYIYIAEVISVYRPKCQRVY